MSRFFVVVTLFLVPGAFAQGPYSPQANVSGSDAIHKDSDKILAWASSCVFYPGWNNIAHKDSGLISGGNPDNALGKAMENPVLSLGDSGVAVLHFEHSIKDGPGPDFAVFENAFSSPDGDFIELAFVEVSSDGANFVRFPAVSLSPTAPQVPSYGTLDPTDIHNLAGKYWTGYGVPFDLAELPLEPGLDISDITHVRIVDAIGAVNQPFTSYDSEGNEVNDPWPTSFSAGGFDLDAVGVINSNGNLSSKIEVLDRKFEFQNPVNGQFLLFGPPGKYTVTLISMLGMESGHYTIETNNPVDKHILPSGIYKAFVHADGLLHHVQTVFILE